MKKTICMVAYTNYVTDARVRREAETLACQPDFDVLFLALKEGGKPVTYTLDKVKVFELNIRKYRGKSRLFYFGSYFKFLILAFLRCSQLLLKNEIDIVHVHNMPNFLIFSGILTRFLKKKLILDMHDSMPETFTAKFEEKSNDFLFKLLCFEEAVCCRIADKIICVNHIQRDILIQRGIPESKIDISINVPDHKKFNLERMNEPQPEVLSSFNLVYHGTITKRLGVDLAIKAVAHLIDRIPNLEFYIFGSGDDKEEFIELSEKLGIANHVHFNDGMISVDELTDALSGMDIGVVSNRRNIATELMLPVKLLEYIALSIPVVAPKLKAISYYFSEDMVTFFEPENIEDLSSAIMELYKNKSRRESQIQLARKFLDRYGWETHQKDLINLYHQL